MVVETLPAGFSYKYDSGVAIGGQGHANVPIEKDIVGRVQKSEVSPCWAQTSGSPTRLSAPDHSGAGAAYRSAGERVDTWMATTPVTPSILQVTVRGRYERATVEPPALAADCGVYSD